MPAIQNFKYYKSTCLFSFKMSCRGRVIFDYTLISIITTLLYRRVVKRYYTLELNLKNKIIMHQCCHNVIVAKLILNNIKTLFVSNYNVMLE